MKITTVLLLCVGSMMISQCKHEEPLSPREMHKALITGATWILQSAVLDNVDKTAAFAGMTLYFTDTGLAATNGLPIWPESNLWAFIDDEGNTIMRDDDVQLSVVEITGQKLVIRVYWATSTFAQGRAVAIKGNYIFTFLKK
jgi:hypothetical protein